MLLGGTATWEMDVKKSFINITATWEERQLQKVLGPLEGDQDFSP